MRSAVVISSYTMDRWSDIGEAIRSVQSQETRADELVIVVDHNVELLNRCTIEFPLLKVVGNSEAKGLSGARNSGVKASTGEIVAFLDDHAIADPAWLRS